ncbi:hypothetical protein [Rubritalea tangerina]|uniref:hypothetical protein n=1 Tax=Rubritalea tangerina TaxID=430798 RepID=UPI003612F656
MVIESSRACGTSTITALPVTQPSLIDQQIYLSTPPSVVTVRSDQNCVENDGCRLASAVRNRDKRVLLVF